MQHKYMQHTIEIDRYPLTVLEFKWDEEPIARLILILPDNPFLMSCRDVEKMVCAQLK